MRRQEEFTRGHDALKQGAKRAAELSCASPSGRWRACVDGGKAKAGMSGRERDKEGERGRQLFT